MRVQGREPHTTPCLKWESVSEGQRRQGGHACSVVTTDKNRDSLSDNASPQASLPALGPGSGGDGCVFVGVRASRV